MVLRNAPADGQGQNIPDADYITKPIGDLTRGELVDALDWCCKELRKHNEEYQHRSRVPVR